MRINTIKQAVKLFGSKAAISRLWGKTPQAICAWPNRLKQEQKDMLLGAAIRTGKIKVEFLD